MVMLYSETDYAANAAAVYQQLTSRLKAAGIPNAAFEAGCMMEQVLQMPWHCYRYTAELTPEQIEMLAAMAERRSAGQPLQYILGEWEFYGMRLFVGEGVLIPRPDTECLIDAVLGYLSRLPGFPASLHFLDLCTGSGCIALALKQHVPAAAVTGIDSSTQALAYARKNRQLHGLDVQFLCGDATNPACRDAVSVTVPEFDVIVSNPPYLTYAEMQHLQKEIRFEPVSALAGGLDGLDFYRRITAIWKDSLKPGGILLYEIGEQQGEAVSGILQQHDFQNVTITKDTECRDRIVSGWK